MKYPPLTGICKSAIESNRCLGCQKLEAISFTGVNECPWLKDARTEIKEILGVQEKLF